MARSSRSSGRSRGSQKQHVEPSSSVTPFAWGALGFFVAAGVTAAAWTGCQRELPIGSVDPVPSAAPPPAPQPVASAAPAPEEADPTLPTPTEEVPADPEVEAELVEDFGDAGADDDAAADEVHYAGAIVPQASIFPNMVWEYDKRLGYVRMAGKVAVDPTPIPSENCTAGWYRVLSGGYVCGRHVTLNLKHPSVRLGVLPNIDDILPYKYGWNRGHGTPLYRSVPSKEEMAKYEPYLNQPAKAEGAETTQAAAKSDAAGDKRAWWEPSETGAKTQVKLADLTVDADSLLARRLVKGFFISIERTFPWAGRHWHKTTEGLIAPADRFVIVKSPTFQGVELAGTDTTQPVGFVLASKARKYEITFVNDKPRLKTGKPVPRYTAVRLTGERQTIGGNVYLETTEGWWMKEKEGTYTEPGPPPPELQPGEKWIDVNLSRQTLVAFEGETPVFATLVSTGKRIKTHETPPGIWRIKHKHISSRMSGDGVAPGEAPYSIDDVPYVMFYEGSYALHGAFWHDAFGRVRSHGCTNLAPLDAKRLFFWTDPPLPEGWHGVYASEQTPGTWIVIHE